MIDIGDNLMHALELISLCVVAGILVWRGK
jgi:hypothetical protein